MKLFCTNYTLDSVTVNPLTLETPLGNVVFKAKINEVYFDSNLLSTVKSRESNNLVGSWKSSNCEIDCLLANFNPVLPSSMKIDKCFAFIWRIKALENLEINLQCLLESCLIGSPESGEHLIAQTFENNSINLSIGTEDEEKLELRSKNNDWIPHRLLSSINSSKLCYLDQGIEARFSLLKEEKIQVQFIVAWVLKTNNDLSTWYAVEQSGRSILNQAGFY